MRNVPMLGVADLAVLPLLAELLDLPRLADDAGKLAVWLNATSNLVITAGKYSGETFATNNYTAAALGENLCSTFNPGAQDTAEPIMEGTNVLVSPMTLGATLTVVGHRSGSNRGCIAAIQIVEVKPEVGENDLIIEVSGPTTYTVSEERTLSGTVYVIGSGTLTLDGSTKITAGTIDVAGNVVFNVNTDRLDAPTFTGSGTVVYDGACPVTGKGWTNSDNWRGTVWVKNISNLVGSSFPMNDYGNSRSTLKVSMLKGWVNTTTTDTDVAPALELDGDCEYALWLSNGNGYNSNNGSRTQIRELKGSGLLKGSDSGPQALLLVKKWDDFSGSIELNNKVVVFGTSLPTQATISGGGYIVVNSGASVEIPSVKTWSVSNGFIVNGTLTATGNMAVTTGSTSTSLVKGSGTVVFDGKLPSPTGDAWWKNANWTGTVQMSSVTFNSTNNGNFNDYGNSASTLKLNNCGGYFMYNYTLVPALEIGGVYTWLDGYSGTGNAFKVSTLKGSGTIWAKNASSGADKAVLQVTSDWSGFTGVINMGSVAGDGRMVVAFGSTLPETIYAGKIYIAPDAIVENKSSSAWWSTGKGFVVDGTFKATGRDKWGGGTAMTLDDTGVLELTSTANAQDYADYSGVTGTGTIKYSSTGGWRTFPSDDAKMPATTLTVQVELADSLIITKNNNGETVIGNLAGSKNIRSDWSATSGGADARTLTVTQSKDTEWQGKFVSNRITQFNVAGTGGTLTLSGTQDATIPANITGSVNLTGTWVGATTVNGTIGGTGTLMGNLTFGTGSTFKAFASDADGLSVSGSIAYPASGTVTVDVSALGAPAAKVVLLTATSESDIDVSKFALADGTNRKYKLAKEGATLILKGARKGVMISVY